MRGQVETRRELFKRRLSNLIMYKLSASLATIFWTPALLQILPWAPLNMRGIGSTAVMRVRSRDTAFNSRLYYLISSNWNITYPGTEHGREDIGWTPRLPVKTCEQAKHFALNFSTAPLNEAKTLVAAQLRPLLLPPPLTFGFMLDPKAKYHTFSASGSSSAIDAATVLLELARSFRWKSVLTLREGELCGIL